MSENTIDQAAVDELVEILSGAPEDVAEALVSLLRADGVEFETTPGETVSDTLLRVTREQPEEVASTILTVLVMGSAMEAMGIW